MSNEESIVDKALSVAGELQFRLQLEGLKAIDDAVFSKVGAEGLTQAQVATFQKLCETHEESPLIASSACEAVREFAVEHGLSTDLLGKTKSSHER